MTTDKKEMRPQEQGSLEGKHITRELFCDWQAGRMKQTEEAEFLGHIGTCTFCAGQLGNWMEEEAAALLPEPPGYLKEEILHRTQQMDVQAAVRIRETSHRMQLLMYSLKVGLAVAASIFLLMVTSNVQNMDIETVRTQRTEQMQKIEQMEKAEKENSHREKNIAGTLKQKSRELSGILSDLSNGLFWIETEQEENQEVTR